MANNHLPTNKPHKRKGIMQTHLKCIQLNLQHSRLATDNLRQIIEEENTDIIFIQEPRTIRSKIAGLYKRLKIFTSGKGKHQVAIAVKNNKLDTMLIKQLLDEDVVVLEVITGNKKIIITSMYFDINRQIDIDLLKLDAIIQHANDAGLLIAMDSNSRSTLWHDLLTNRRGRTLEEYLMSKQMHIMNEESHLTTFRSSRGTSRIDLTIINNQLLSAVCEWEISEQDSCSDHSILRCVVGHSNAIRAEREIGEVKYKVTKEGKEKFQSKLIRLAEHKFSDTLSVARTETLDKILCTRATTEPVFTLETEFCV